MGQIQSVEISIQKVKNIQDISPAISNIYEPVESQEQNAPIFSDLGYFSYIKDSVKPYSKLYFPLGKFDGEESIIWIHLPNDTTNQQFYDFCTNSLFVIFELAKISVFDFAEVENVKRYTLMLTALAFVILGAFIPTPNKQQINKLITLSITFLILATIIIWGLQSNQAPKKYYELTDVGDLEAIFLPLHKNDRINQNATISASSLQEFTQKVQNIIEMKKGLPLSLPQIGSQKTYSNGMSTSSTIYKDEHYTVEFSALAPNGALSTHSHDVEVVVIPLTDGFSGILNGGESKEFTKYKALSIKAGVNHSFKVGSEGGYLISIHSSSTPSLFLDIS